MPRKLTHQGSCSQRPSSRTTSKSLHPGKRSPKSNCGTTPSTHRPRVCSPWNSGEATSLTKLSVSVSRGSSSTTACIDAIKNLSAKDRQTLTFARSHCPTDEAAQTELSANLSSTSSNKQQLFVEHRVATIRHKSPKNDKGSSNYPLVMKESPANKVELQNEKLDTTNVENLEECHELSSFSQKSKYRVLISLGVNVRTPCAMPSLLDKGAGLPPQNWQAHVKPVKAPLLESAIREPVPVPGIISLQIND